MTDHNHNCPTAAFPDFSQYGEQPIILDFFARHTDAPHYCVDAGAYDGVIGSNSRALFLQGWSGIVIEPDPRTFSRVPPCMRIGPTYTHIRRALSNRTGLARMRFTQGPPGTKSEDEWKYAQVNTLSERFAKHFRLSTTTFTRRGGYGSAGWHRF